MTYPTGDRPIFLTSGDFNRDNMIDLAIIYRNSSTIDIFLNNGNGSFRNATLTFAILSLNTIITGDFNNDGRLDLATTAKSRDGIFVVLGNGDGTFGPYLESTTSSALSLEYIVTSDFNKDGRLDVAVYEQKRGNVFVGFGSGNGTFQHFQQYSMSPSVMSMAVGDFNSDQYLDLAVAIGSDRSIALLFGNKNGTFENQLIRYIDYVPFVLIMADFDITTEKQIWQ